MSEIKLRKANRIVRVTENELDKYLSVGYVVVPDKKVQPTSTKVEEPVKVEKPVVESQKVDAEPKSEVFSQSKKPRKRRN